MFTGAGDLYTVTFSATGTVTAGVITLYDSVTEANTVIWSGTLQVALNPVSVNFNGLRFSTGLYVGYDGTIANVATTVVYEPIHG